MLVLLASGGLAVWYHGVSYRQDLDLVLGETDASEVVAEIASWPNEVELGITIRLANPGHIRVRPPGQGGISDATLYDGELDASALRMAFVDERPAWLAIDTTFMDCDLAFREISALQARWTRLGVATDAPVAIDDEGRTSPPLGCGLTRSGCIETILMQSKTVTVELRVEAMGMDPSHGPSRCSIALAFIDRARERWVQRGKGWEDWRPTELERGR